MKCTMRFRTNAVHVQFGWRSLAGAVEPSGEPHGTMLKSYRAEVAELADAQDLGSCGRKAVKVQLLSSAPLFIRSDGRD